MLIVVRFTLQFDKRSSKDKKKDQDLMTLVL